MDKPLHIDKVIELEIPFHDVDSAGIAWHGHYVKYFEIARCALLDSIGYNYTQMKDSGYFWPVIDLHLRYAKPARFQQKVQVKACLLEWEHRLKIAYEIRDIATGERLTKGSSTQVAVDIQSGEMLLASPPVLLKQLGLTE